MEQNLQRRVAGLKDKLPDIQKTLDTVRFLKLRPVGRGSNVLEPAKCMVLTRGCYAGRPSRIRLRRHSS